MTTRRSFAMASVAAVLAAGGVVAWSSAERCATFPPPAPFEAVQRAYQPSDIRLLDRHGEVIQEIRVDKSGRRLSWTSLAEISAALRDAVIISEDRRFYRHGGVDWGALLAAASGGARRGASTISMQLATLLDRGLRRGNGPRSLAQKWRQMRAAWALERTWTKGQILEAYLNLVSFRGELQGVSAAADGLFGKAPHGLTEPEAAVLAALVRGPNAGRGTVARRAWRLCEARGSAARRGDIEAAAARALDAAAGNGPRVALAPHAARRVLGGRRHPSADVPTWQMTLDASVQRVATDVLRRQLLSLHGRHVTDSAVLVVDNTSGAVLAYVGGAGRLSSAANVDGVQARRQAGSTLKPFLYALAFEERILTATSLVDDSPLDVVVAGGVYRPRNYDGEFRGRVSVRTALASSLNVPAVRVLGLLDPEAFVARLRGLGFAEVRESGDHYGPSLALGSADVRLWELVNAYRTLANGGVWSPLSLQPGELRAGRAKRAYSEASVRVVSDILADRESRSLTFGLDSALSTRFWSAVKTGTSKEMRDNWCVGYTNRYTVGVWVGNFSGEPMHDVSGVTGAAPAWLEIVNWLHRDTPSQPPALPVPGLDAGSSAPFVLPAGAGLPRILAPAAGSIMAIDPDIPEESQQVIFEADAGAGHRWVLDGGVLGPATTAVAWRPIQGAHTLSLVGDDGRAVDRVSFRVRGGKVRAELPPRGARTSSSAG